MLMNLSTNLHSPLCLSGAQVGSAKVWNLGLSEGGIVSRLRSPPSFARERESDRGYKPKGDASEILPTAWQGLWKKS